MTAGKAPHICAILGWPGRAQTPRAVANTCVEELTMADSTSAPTGLLYAWRRAVVADDSPLSSTARLVALTWSLWVQGDVGHPGATKVSRAAGLSLRATREAFADLIAAGFLELAERGGQKGERKRANAYRVIPHGCTTVTGNARSRVTETPLMGAPPAPRIGSKPNGTTRVRVREADPMASTAAATSRRYDLTELRRNGKACASCGGCGVIETDKGYVECPTCGGDR